MRYQTHLTKRGRIYYGRVRIPRDLIASFRGRRELKISLRTSDRNEAVLRVRHFSARCAELFARHRKSLMEGGSHHES